MSNKSDMELLLQEISELYKENTNTNYLDIDRYLNREDKETNLINVQSNFYQNKKDYEKRGIKITPCHEYLSVIIPGKDKIVTDEISKANNFRIELSIEEDDIYEVSSRIIEYLYKNKILSEYRIQNYYNERVASIIITTVEDLLIVIKYIGSRLKKKIKNNFKPFVCNEGNINIFVDGTVSYNIVLSKIIDRYMHERETYDNITITSFLDFLEESMIEKRKEYTILLYGIGSEEQYQDFITIVNIIKDNICNNLSLENLEKYQKRLNIKEKKKFTEDDQDLIKQKAVRESLDIMLEIYDEDENVNNNIEKLHEVITKFLKEKDYHCFPNQKSLNEIVCDIITPDKFGEYLIRLGTDALFKVCVDTRMKYGDVQLNKALLEAKKTGKIDSFTNVNGNRSELGIVFPKELLKEIIQNDLKEELIKE